MVLATLLHVTKSNFPIAFGLQHTATITYYSLVHSYWQYIEIFPIILCSYTTSVLKGIILYSLEPFLHLL